MKTKPPQEKIQLSQLNDSLEQINHTAILSNEEKRILLNRYSLEEIKNIIISKRMMKQSSDSLKNLISFIINSNNIKKYEIFYEPFKLNQIVNIKPFKTVFFAPEKNYNFIPSHLVFITPSFQEVMFRNEALTQIQIELLYSITSWVDYQITNYSFISEQNDYIII